MARQRRGGFRKPELKGTLGTLLRTAVAQAGTVRDVLERGAREGRHRLDEVMAGRRRHEALAELGEIVLDLIRRGEIDAQEIPEVRDIVAHLDELDADHPPDEPELAAPPSRKRFDDRGDDGTVSSRQWSPPARRKKSDTTVWKPTARKPDERPGPPEVRAKAKTGGISFDDEDLSEYMHPDDVPPKPPSEGDS